MKINILPEQIANMIAAGEVVERPASVVKELLENSIDAGAKNITVEIKNGGVSFISVTDNGIGMDSADAVTAFERHATSKISHQHDLESISTLGFRGEALPSIASVSRVNLTTKTSDSLEGTCVTAEGGKIIKSDCVGCTDGTRIVVENLFFNTPARMKFLKKDSLEASYVADMVEKLALGYPEISFKFINNRKEIFFTPGNGDLLRCVYAIYGGDYAKSLLNVDNSTQNDEYAEQGIKITGYVGKAVAARANRAMQIFFVNRRYVKSKILTRVLEEAYRNILTVNKFPVAILCLQISPEVIDVNVHPSKTEIKFMDEKKVSECFYWAVKNTLYAIPAPAKNDYCDTQKVSTSRTHCEYPIDNDQPDDNFLNQPLYGMNMEVVDVTNNRAVQPPPVINMAANRTPLEINAADAINHSLDNVQPPYNLEPDYTSKDKPVIAAQEILQWSENITDVSQHQPNQLYKIVGQIFNTYIAIEKDNEILLIDQHAAHERLEYEQLFKTYSSRKPMGQVLLTPVTVNLTGVEMDIVEQNHEFLNKLGFETENFGNNSIIIRQVPLVSEDLKALFLEVVDMLGTTRGKSGLTNIEYKILYSVACKGAIKANKKMSDIEMRSLVDKVLSIEERDGINTCPHGRPITISLSRSFIEKQFKRV